DILTAVKDSTKKSMVYDGRAVRRLIRSEYGNDGIIPLSVFKKNEIGICRHHNLDVAIQLEALIAEDLLYGRSAVERRIDLNHAWPAFYEEGSIDEGSAWVIDSTSRLNFVGTKNEFARLGKDYFLEGSH